MVYLRVCNFICVGGLVDRFLGSKGNGWGLFGVRRLYLGILRKGNIEVEVIMW